MAKRDFFCGFIFFQGAIFWISAQFELAAEPSTSGNRRCRLTARVRLSLDNDAKSLALAARSPRHGYSPGNSKRASDTRPDYSITSSAQASRVGGTVRLSVFAVLRLTAKRNLVGCFTGSSAAWPRGRSRRARSYNELWARWNRNRCRVVLRISHSGRGVCWWWSGGHLFIRPRGLRSLQRR